MSNEFEAQRIRSYIISLKKIQIFGYLILPLILIVKWLIIALIIYSGGILFNNTIKYKICLKIILLAELAQTTLAVIKLAYFIIHPPINISNIQNFNPLSVTDVFKLEKLPNYITYSLGQINIFEFFYCLLIAFGIKTFIQKPFGYSMRIVASSYGVALCVWVLCVVFIQLQFAP